MSEPVQLQPDEDMKSIQLSVLKELVNDVNADIATLSEEMDLPFQTVNGIVTDFVRLLVGTRKETDWPERVRKLYNKDVTEPELLLTSEDMNILKAVVNRFHDKKVEKMSRVKKKEAPMVMTDNYAQQQPPPTKV
jgi:hypothetical protein